MDNEHNTMTAGAEEVPVKKLKLSEILTALKNGNVEADAKACLLTYDEKGVHAICDMPLLNIMKKEDVRMALLHQGLTRMAAAVMKGDGEATAFVAKYALGDADVLPALVQRLLNDSDSEEGEDHE